MMTIHHHYQYLHHQHYSKLPFSEICSSLLAAAGDDALSTHQTQVGFVAVFLRRGFAHFDGFVPSGAELEVGDARKGLEVEVVELMWVSGCGYKFEGV